MTRNTGKRRAGEDFNLEIDRINALIHSTLDFDKIMQGVVSRAAKAIKSETAAISLRRRNQWIIKYTHGFKEKVAGTRMSGNQERHAVLAIQTKKPVVINDALNDKRVDREHMKNWGIRSVLVVPLVTENKTIGAAFFNRHQAGRPFNESQIDFANKLASTVSLALHNARLLEKVRSELAERSKAEEAVRKSEEILRTIFESTREGVVILDGEMRCLKANPAAGTITGMDYKQLVGRYLNEFVSPEFDLSMAWGAFLQTGMFSGEVGILHADGTRRLIEANGMANIIPGQHLFIGYDITAHKRIHETLAHERFLLRTLIDSLPNLVYFKDTQSRFITANLATARLMKRKDPAELMGKTDADFYPPEFAGKYCADEQEIIRTGEPKLNMEETVLDENNCIRVLSTSKVPLKDADGKVFGLVGLGVDVTDRKRMEDILKRDKETLARLVNEKTREVILMQREAEKTRRLTDIGMLASTVAHELRNPLAAIRLAAYNLRRKSKEPSVQTRMNTIEQKIQESEQIINNLLFYSRIRILQYEWIDLYNILAEVSEIIEEHAKNKDVTLLKKFEPAKNVLIQADPLQLKELFINLINNAYDAAADNAGVIEIGADIGHESAVVSITDNGHGISREIMDKIWEPFFSTKSKGTGLGLAVCRQIADLHKIALEIQSMPGHGTTIRVSMALKRP